MHCWLLYVLAAVLGNVLANQKGSVMHPMVDCVGIWQVSNVERPAS